MKTEREVAAEIDKLYALVEQNDPTANIVYGTLRWVTGDEDESPYDQFIGEGLS